MRVVLGSAHRNNRHRHGVYFDQIDSLRHALSLRSDRKWSLRVIAVEGDSTDGTRDSLRRYATARKLKFDLRTCNHGGPVYGSTESPNRLAALSRVGNCILDGVNDTDDMMIYVESDLLWDAPTMVELMIVASSFPNMIVAPFIFAGEHFYDTFLFRGTDGKRFAPFPPYHSSLSDGYNLLSLVNSAGSCLVMPAHIPRNRACRMVDNALLDFCANARANGYRIAVSRAHRVEHPV